jgi:hypothetical protein
LAKRALKKGIREDQNGECAISGAPLPEDTSLFDTDRRTPKAKGGTYTDENTRVVNPVVHMMRHGNWRERSPEFQALKEIIDDREQVRKAAMKVNNQLHAYQRRVDTLNEGTELWLKDHKDSLDKDLKNRDALLTKAVNNLAKVDPLAAIAMKVKGVGPVTVAYCLVYIDLEKAQHASSLWAYAGLDKPQHARYVKGTAGGGNKALRTVLYTLADSQMKGRNRPTPSAYGYLYDQIKTRLENSEKIVKTRDTKGMLVECAWKDTKPSHRHGAALRIIMKHFLADYWFVGRTLMGLPTSAGYPETMLGGTHRTIMPQERGWVY